MMGGKRGLAQTVETKSRILPVVYKQVLEIQNCENSVDEDSVDEDFRRVFDGKHLLFRMFRNDVKDIPR